MEKLEARTLIFDDEEITRAGAFVTLDRYGKLAVYRGFVRPEDEPREDADVHTGEPVAGGPGAELSAGSNVDGIDHGTVITSTGQALGANVPDDEDEDEDEDEDDGALKPLWTSRLTISERRRPPAYPTSRIARSGSPRRS
ncbi:hypothetical protein PhaeoP23_03683 (plasmid) [Phaeobacter piscinae]|uniref:Uncharacterized protein n=1 Tax=Phaeobacter piscinae TaxID=1580596 RepID=A0ABM6PIS9_9RHOB|nr:hypothetical protein PhaeoP36_03683 [Phaeobacter piscinae]AUQ88281.1 hypothetical protein PhaeoP42_03684 [Phaeobacter piscinae]AUR26164.1 hypothetical protein PhaeoP23_03683 [Phaeobacter piscinae]